MNDRWWSVTSDNPDSLLSEVRNTRWNHCSNTFMLEIIYQLPGSCFLCLFFLIFLPVSELKLSLRFPQTTNTSKHAPSWVLPYAGNEWRDKNDNLIKDWINLLSSLKLHFLPTMCGDCRHKPSLCFGIPTVRNHMVDECVGTENRRHTNTALTWTQHREAQGLQLMPRCPSARHFTSHRILLCGQSHRGTFIFLPCLLLLHLVISNDAHKSYMNSMHSVLCITFHLITLLCNIQQPSLLKKLDIVTKWSASLTENQ